MRRILLRISYDGTLYHGFQIQEGVPTIEGRIRSAILMLTGKEAELIGGSRTDAGVHAMDNVAVFDTDSRIETERFAYALNAYLPEDIRITSSAEVPGDFHPRHCKSRKTYEYRILRSDIPIPILRRYVHHTSYDLNTEDMRRAAGYFCGEHDFKGFAAANMQAQTSVRTIYELTVTENDGPFFQNETSVSENDGVGNDADISVRSVDKPREIVIRVTGNGFLYNMVRILAGTLLDVGRGKISPDRIPEIIDSLDRSKAGPTLPPNGLCLMRYEFEDHEEGIPCRKPARET